jgi:hypothetical protein
MRLYVRVVGGYGLAMNTPMVGSWSVEVKDVRPFTIHGDLYYELDVVQLDDRGGTVLAVRVPQHAVSGVPKPGDKLAISFLMGQVTAARAI